MNVEVGNGWISVPSGTGIEGPITIMGEPPMPVERIDIDKRGVDDVAIGPVETFRLERMTKHSFWCAVYMADGSRHVFWIDSDKPVTVRHHKEPPL